MYRHRRQLCFWTQGCRFVVLLPGIMVAEVSMGFTMEDVMHRIKSVSGGLGF